MMDIVISHPNKKINRLIYVLFFLFFSLFATAKAEVSLDEFSTTQIVWPNEQSCVTGPNIIGGERDIWGILDGGVQINSVVSHQLHLHNQSTTNWTRTRIVYDGLDGDASSSYYNGLGNIDLTQGGQNDRFALDFTAISNSGGSVGISVFQVGFKGSEYTINLPTNAQTIYLPFDQFVVFDDDPWSPVDFSDAGNIELFFELFPGESCTVDSFYVIPEPATILLVSLGGLMIRKKRSFNLELQFEPRS